MAHKQKYTRGAIGHMLAHYERSKEIPELKYPNKTILNYNLAKNEQPLNQLEFLHKRLKEVKVLNRKDVNVMVDWVVTLPKNLPDYDKDKFFEETYNFLNKRYGKENVISAYVHMDEATPHMHYSFIPITQDKKHGGFKLSAKEVITRTDLKTFHTDLSQYLENALGYDTGILNEATKEGNKSIEELKRGTAKKELDAISLESHKMLLEQQKLNKDIKDAKIKEEVLKKQLESLEREIKGFQLKLYEINQIKPQKTITGTIKGITIEEIENLKTTSLLAIKTLEENKKLLNENDWLKRKIQTIEKQVPSIKSKLEDAKNKQRLSELEKIFENLPENIKMQFITEKDSSISNFRR